MKRFYSIVAVVFCFVMPLMAQQAFEGKVVYDIKGDDVTTTMTFLCKQPKIRMESNIQGNDFQTILDASTKTMTVVMHQAQMYMQINMGEQAAKAKQHVGAVKDKAEGMIGNAKKTGKTKKILGYECEQWYEKTNEGETEVWVTKELGSFQGLGTFSGGTKTGGMMGGKMPDAVPPGLSGLVAANYFPMLAIHRAPDGKIKGSMEATAVEKKSLDASLFTPPKGYTKMEMPAGMPMMEK